MIERAEQIRILCVDDEKNILQALERSFLDECYEIVNAGSGAEGLQALEASGPFQVVISDYRMPVMNGVEFLKKVYARWPDTVRLVLSGYADVGAIVAAINEGHIYKFIPKPWDDQDLRLTIPKSLEHYHLQTRNRELEEELDAANRTLEKRQQHSGQTDLRNQTRELSVSILGNLPAGVVALDEQGLVVYCNDRGRTLLAGGPCGDAAADVPLRCEDSLARFAEEVRRGMTASAEVELGGTLCPVRGMVMSCEGKELVILLLLEVAA